MTCFQQQGWQKILNHDYLTAYAPEQILAVKDYILNRLASNHLARPSKEILFTLLLRKARIGQQLTDMVLDANIKIKDLHAKENLWFPLLATHRRIFTQEELYVIAKGSKTGFRNTLWAIIHAKRLKEQGKVKNWDIHNQLRQLIQLLGEKPDYEFVKLGVQYRTRTLFQRINKQQEARIQKQIQYIVP